MNPAPLHLLFSDQLRERVSTARLMLDTDDPLCGLIVGVGRTRHEARQKAREVLSAMRAASGAPVFQPTRAGGMELRFHGRLALELRPRPVEGFFAQLVERGVTEPVRIVAVGPDQQTTQALAVRWLRGEGPRIAQLLGFYEEADRLTGHGLSKALGTVREALAGELLAVERQGRAEQGEYLLERLQKTYGEGGQPGVRRVLGAPPCAR